MAGAPLGWLLQPGFIVAAEASGPPPYPQDGDAQLLWAEHHAALHDVLSWCAAAAECEGLTHAMPSSSMPTDRLAAACYCCRVGVRTSRLQLSWTKWAPPLTVLAQQQRPQQEDDEEDDEDDEVAKEDEVDDDEAAKVSNPGGGRRRGRHSFSARLGYVAGGAELLLRSGFLTLERATRWCDQHARCDSFSCKAPEVPAVVLFFSFYRAGGARVHHPGWYVWSRGVSIEQLAAVAEASAESGGSEEERNAKLEL